jgi:hypothetical protein
MTPRRFIMRMRSHLVRRVLAGAFVAGAVPVVLVAPSPAGAVTATVTTCSDGVCCTFGGHCQ